MKKTPDRQKLRRFLKKEIKIVNSSLYEKKGEIKGCL
jgi:hypothetical protein